MKATRQHQLNRLVPLQFTQIEGYSEIYDNAAYGISFVFGDEEEQARGTYAPLAPFNSIQRQSRQEIFQVIIAKS
jgi:hypothetical protein